MIEHLPADMQEIEMEAIQTASSFGKNLPNDLAHEINAELFNVLTLLYSANEQVGIGTRDSADADNMTSNESRFVALISMADGKVRDVLRAMSPYV